MSRTKNNNILSTNRRPPKPTTVLDKASDISGLMAPPTTGYLARLGETSMISCIMAMACIRRFLGMPQQDTLYYTATLSLFLSSTGSLAFQEINLNCRSRNKKTILIASLLTLLGCLATGLVFIARTSHLAAKYSGKTLSHSEMQMINKYNQLLVTFDIIPGILIVSQCILCMLLQFALLNKAKRTFTYGEAAFVSQLISLAYITWALTTYSKLSAINLFNVSLPTDIILNIGASVFFIGFLASYSLGEAKAPKYVCLAMSIWVGHFLAGNCISRLASSETPITWLAVYLFSKHQIIGLFSLWLCVVAACVVLSNTWSLLSNETNCVVRKAFHFAVAVVFISGYKQDVEFTRFAAGGMVIILMILEMIRAWQLAGPFGALLERLCSSLRGKWDNRYLTMSHIYLLVGVFLPLWLVPFDLKSAETKLVLSSGLISVCIGDTAAAVLGTTFGHRVLCRETGKTLVGLLANIVAMIGFKMFWVGLESFPREISFLMAACFTAYNELYTRTCDNLKLPIVMTWSLMIFNCQ